MKTILTSCLSSFPLSWAMLPIGKLLTIKDHFISTFQVLLLKENCWMTLWGISCHHLSPSFLPSQLSPTPGCSYSCAIYRQAPWLAFNILGAKVLVQWPRSFRRLSSSRKPQSGWLLALFVWLLDHQRILAMGWVMKHTDLFYGKFTY